MGRFSNVMSKARKSKYTVNSQLLQPGMKLDQQCIMMHGYLVKSPPLEKILRRVARWRMRWFVLYDTKARAAIDPGVEREVEIYYYKTCECQQMGELPMGKINLLGADVYASVGKLHGYPYVINVRTDERTFHLCATQKVVHKEWLIKLKAHSVPPTLPRPAVTFPYEDNATASHRPVSRVLTGLPNNNNTIARITNERTSTSSTAPTSPAPISPNVFSNPFNTGEHFFHPVPAPCMRNTHSAGSISEATRSDDDYECDDELSYPAFVFRDEINHTKKLQVKPTLSKLPLNPLLDSDTDEGIVRTSSESSSTSTASTSTSTQITMTRITTPDVWDMGGCAFRGPKLKPTPKKLTLSHQKSRSLLDLRSVGRIRTSTNHVRHYTNEDKNNNDLFIPRSREDAAITLARLGKEKRNSTFILYEATL